MGSGLGMGVWGMGVWWGYGDKGDRANANILGEWGMWMVRNGMGMGEGDKVGGQGGCPPYKLKKFRLWW